MNLDTSKVQYILLHELGKTSVSRVSLIIPISTPLGPIQLVNVHTRGRIADEACLHNKEVFTQVRADPFPWRSWRQN